MRGSFGVRAVRSVGSVGFIVLVAACTGANPADNTPTATSTTSVGPSTSSPVDSAKQRALVVYVGMWDSYAVAAATSDWQSAQLAQFATGAALSTMSRGLYADRYNGVVSRGHPSNNPVVSSVDPADLPMKVGISDCGDSTNWRKYRVDTGQPVEGQPGGRRRINAVVEKQADGSWRVSDFGVKEVGSC